MAKNLSAGLSRIQFTPDLLPSDITGTEIYHNVGGKDLLYDAINLITVNNYGG